MSSNMEKSEIAILSFLWKSVIYSFDNSFLFNQFGWRMIVCQRVRHPPIDRVTIIMVVSR